MATPVITVSFTADVQCGVSPLTVQFTDTTNVTDGFARIWLWEFGDGAISEDQNPSHVYTGDPGQVYDVALSVLATEGEFDALSVGTLSATRVSNLRIASGGHATNNEAWAARVSAPLTDSFAEHTVSFNGAQYFYKTNDPTLLLKSASSSLAFILIQTKIDVTINDIQGVIEIDGNIGTPSVTNVWTVFGRLAEVTTANPKEVIAQVTPQIQLGDPPTGHKWGNRASFRTRTYANTSTQSFGEGEEVGFISLATLPIADFAAAPTLGAGPLSVQFTNTTIQSDCGPAATYSWKKRISGSGDAFVEFSTAENPLESFTK
jgi:PKD repeat protein